MTVSKIDQSEHMTFDQYVIYCAKRYSSHFEHLVNMHDCLDCGILPSELLAFCAVTAERGSPTVCLKGFRTSYGIDVLMSFRPKLSLCIATPLKRHSTLIGSDFEKHENEKLTSVVIGITETRPESEYRKYLEKSGAFFSDHRGYLRLFGHLDLAMLKETGYKDHAELHKNSGVLALMKGSEWAI